ncbi:MAG: class I SAM-dependent rRNA methyltransferase [Planctomycetota bacterium]|nr:class I SAM-dependent rRNA methyltransferase [Planctomycetota bacterium]
MARRSPNHRSQRPPRNTPPRHAPSDQQIDDVSDEPSTYAAAPASKEMTSLMVRQRTQLGPAATESIPVIHARNRTRHPILYRKQIARIEDAKPGDLVAVYTDGQQEHLGYGVYNPRSEMSVRMLWNTPQFPTDDAWTEKLRAAISLRRDILKLDAQSDAWRVVHSESDGLSGIVIDRFGDVLSAETFGLGMYQRASLLMPMLASQMGVEHWLVRTSPQFLSQEGCDPPPITSEGCPAHVVISENGTRFRIRFEGGQTGFFCDQRENRRKLAEFCEGKSVLDVCCYTGGFSVQAKILGKADDVTGVDLDEEPLKLARENANLNQARAKFVQADAFNYMREMLRNGKQYDVVVLDPPKLIRTRVEIEEGTRKHFAMNRLAMRLVKPGGLLLSCTCAGLLPESEFLQLLVSASKSQGDDLDPHGSSKIISQSRTLQIIARTGAAPDHPVISTCMETDYLKAVWMIVN